MHGFKKVCNHKTSGLLVLCLRAGAGGARAGAWRGRNGYNKNLIEPLVNITTWNMKKIIKDVNATASNGARTAPPRREAFILLVINTPVLYANACTGIV
ncbi:hypothetical protein EVAR_98303_1 [Eumeta japonica]|uniref:Secreted protein n=1 Tax=Eumeta variegata TaxID=151549 RepID=A0A4C1XDR6_EUMVA|nr:hypothetical protein EVAR_98303_1 [Eumeta japonica]